MKCKWIAAAGIWLAAWIAYAQAGTNAWTATGPDGGHVFGISFHPSRPDTAFAVTAVGRFRTTDSGQSWTRLNNQTSGTGNQQILLDPNNPDRMLIGSGVIYRSEDAGQTFSLLSAPGDDPGTPFADASVFLLRRSASDNAVYAATHNGKVFRSTDFGELWTELNPVPNPPGPGQRIVDVAVDPATPNTMYLVYESKVFKSIDTGTSWTLLQTFVGAWRLAISPADTQRLLLATSQDVFRSNDGGAHWDPVTGANAEWVGFDPAAPAHAVAVSARNRILHSSDAGEHWTDVAPLRVDQVRDAAFDPFHAGTLLVASSEGVHFSSNYGASFQYRTSGIHEAIVSSFTAASDGSVYASFFPGPIGIFRRDAGGWAPVDNAALRTVIADPNGFGLDVVTASPTDPATLFAGSRIVASTLDAGATWSGVQPTAMPDQLTDIAFDPADARNVFLTTLNNGLLRTTDSGATWSPLGAGLPQWLYWLAIDPANPNVMFTTGDAPHFGTLFKSSDGGANWMPSQAGLNGFTVRDLAFDPANSAVVYAASGVGGLFRSADAGATWTQLHNPGQSDPTSNWILVDPAVPTTLWAGEQRSIDGGTTWETLPALPSPLPTSLTDGILDPLRPNVLIAGASYLGVVEITVAPDLSIAFQQIDPTPATSTTTVALLRVENHGPFGASAVKFDVTLPAWLSVTTPPAGCTVVAATLRCVLGPLQSGQHDDTTVALNVGSAASSGAVTASVSGHESDPNTSNNSTSVNVASSPVADLRLALSTSAATVRHGDTVTLTATATNAGPSIAANALLTIQTDTAMNVMSATPSRGSCTINAATVSCQLGSLNAAASASVQIAAHAAGVGTLVTTAQVAASGGDPDTSNNAASVSIAASAVSDLSITLDSSASTVNQGEDFTLAATAANAGPSVANSVALTILVGTTASAVSATPSQGSCTVSAGIVNCQLGSLNAAASASVQVAARAGGVGALVTTAQVSAASSDPDGSNNSASVSVASQALADLSLTLATSAATVNHGDNFTLAATATNAGPSIAANALLTIQADAAMNVMSATPSQGSCTINAGTVSCQLGSLNAAASASVQIAARAGGAGTLATTAQVASSISDPLPVNNSATAQVTSHVAGDVRIELSDSADPVTTGQTFEYTLTVRNTGPDSGSAQASMTVSGSTLSAATSDAGSCRVTATTAECTFATLPANGSAVAKITAIAGAAGTASASAAATFSAVDPNTDNNSVSTTTRVEPPLPPGGGTGGGSTGSGNTGSGSSGRGGGGSVNWFLLAALALLARVRASTYHRLMVAF